MSADIDAKVAVRYTASTWHIHAKFQRNTSIFSLENGVLVTSRDFGSKQTANFQWLLECRVVKQNATKKCQIMPDLTRYKMAILD